MGLSPTIGASFLPSLTSELFGVLDRGVASLDDNRNGRPWPRPRKRGIEQLVERYDPETCRQAAREAREIVQSQEFAPNITGLFAKKCEDIERERLERRELLRRTVG